MSEWTYSSQFYVDDSKISDVQQSAEYQDVSELHSYLNSTKTEGEFIPKFEVMNSIMDCFSDLRAIAEDEEAKLDWIRVRSQRESIPLSIDAVCRYFGGLAKNTEPPLRMIVKIAENEYRTIGYLINNLHKVLRRDRQMVKVDKAQQLDSQCMVWLSRQPGRNSAQRAGVRQEILSVVRYESLDTLENRVLKECLRLCVINADSYIHDFGSNTESRRVASVRNLKKLCLVALESPEFKKISRLKSIPVPNYVLLNNVNYNAIWNAYMQLVRRTRLLESIWRNRHIVFKDMVKLMTFAAFHEYVGFNNSPIRFQVWISNFIDDNTSNYLAGTNWLYVEYDETYNIQYRLISLNLNMILEEWQNRQNTNRKMSFAYIPSGINREGFSNKNNLIVFKESEFTRVEAESTGRIMTLTPSSDIVEKLYSTIKALFFY